MRDAQEFRLIAQKYVDELLAGLIVFAPSLALAAEIANQEVPAG